MNRYKYEEYNELLRRADQAVRDIRLKCGDDGFPDKTGQAEWHFYHEVKTLHIWFAEVQKWLDKSIIDETLITIDETIV